MRSFQHLLCPVDLSEPSARALRYAAALRSLVGGELSILHVTAADAHQPDPERGSDTSLDKFVSDIVDAKLSLRLLQRQGEPVSEILDTAVALASQLIVMGTHGRTGLQRLLLGSVTERVIRRSTIPVLTVPPGWRNEPQGPLKLESVLCAVDFSEPSASAVECAASIAAAARARFVLAHAVAWSEETETLPYQARSSLPTSEDDAIARMEELVTDEIRLCCDPELVVGHGAAADGVERLVHERHVDLVVLGVRRRNPIDLAVFGSTARRLILDGACPVLTVCAIKSS